MAEPLRLLCAGAAQGLVSALRERFRADSGAELHGRFGAVGALREALLGGEPCDAIVLTDALIDALAAAGRVRGDTRAALGKVRTGLAVRAGDARPDVSSPQSLKAALLAAGAIHFPDPQRATAGIHFAKVLRELGIAEQLRERLHAAPNGATAMQELAVSRAPHALGCTQISEIVFADGVELAGALPAQYELATVYTAAVAANAMQPELAARFVGLLADASASAQRAAAGFER